MTENDSIRDLLEAALRKLGEARVERPAAEPSHAEPSQQTQTSPGHPGLERFTIIESDSEPAAKKTCYMEPDRPCVKSGACEMRGY
jgi:hypothetical protein